MDDSIQQLITTFKLAFKVARQAKIDLNLTDEEIEELISLIDRIAVLTAVKYKMLSKAERKEVNAAQQRVLFLIQKSNIF